MTEAFPDREPISKAAELRVGLEHLIGLNADKLRAGDDAFASMRLGVAVTIPGERIRYGGNEHQFPDTLVPYRVERSMDAYKVWQDDTELRRIGGIDESVPRHKKTLQALYLINGLPGPALETGQIYRDGRVETRTDPLDPNSAMLDGWLEVLKGTPYDYGTHTILRHPVKNGLIEHPDRLAPWHEVEAVQRESALNAMSPMRRLLARALGWTGLR